MAATKNTPLQDTKSRWIGSPVPALGTVVNSPWTPLTYNVAAPLGKVQVIEGITAHASCLAAGTTQRAVWLAGHNPTKYAATFSGTATAAGNTTLTMAGATWTTNQWVGYRVIANNGAGTPRYGIVESNTATVLTIASTFSGAIQWATQTGAQAGSNPANTANFVISDQDEGGVATATNATTLTDSTKAWTTNQWAGWVVVATNDGAATVAGVIRSNTGTVLTLAGTGAARWSSSGAITGTPKYTIQPGPTCAFVHGKLAAVTAPQTDFKWEVEFAIPEGYLLSCFGDNPDGADAFTQIEVYGRFETTSMARSLGLLSYYMRACYTSAAAAFIPIPAVTGKSVVIENVHVSGNPLGNNDTIVDFFNSAAGDSPDFFAFTNAATVLGYEHNVGFKTRIAGPLGYGVRHTPSAAAAFGVNMVFKYDATPNVWDPRGIPQQWPEVTGTHDGTASATVITDPSKAWPTDYHRNKLIYITAGVNAGEYRTIASNTGQTITVSPAFPTNLTATSQYAVVGNGDCGGDYFWYHTQNLSVGLGEAISMLPVAAIGRASAGTSTTITDAVKAWTTNVPAGLWIGYTVEVIAGTNAGSSARITANTATQITFTPAMGAANDTTSVYVIRRGGAPTGFGAQTTGTATSGAAGTLTDNSKSFQANQLVGLYMLILNTTGAAVVGIGKITSNTATVINWTSVGGMTDVIGGSPSGGAGCAYAIGSLPPQCLQTLDVNGWAISTVGNGGGTALANVAAGAVAQITTPTIGVASSSQKNMVDGIHLPLTGAIGVSPAAVSNGPAIYSVLMAAARGGATVWGRVQRRPTDVGRIRPPHAGYAY